MPRAAPIYDAAEYDAVVASGEASPRACWRSCSRTWGSTRGRGKAGKSRSPPTTRTARRASPASRQRISSKLADRQIAVVAGFQGIHAPSGRVTTLGRGGSDTSAVALAAALHADRCDIYTDVDGVYTTDPRVVPKARRLDKVSFEEMLEMASLGAKVLQVRSVEVAMVHKVKLYVRSSFDDPADPKLGTLICDEEDIVEQQVVTGIAFSRDEAQITLREVADKPGVAAAIFVPLAEAGVNVDMIIQGVSDDTTTTDITFTVPTAEFDPPRRSSSSGARRSAIRRCTARRTSSRFPRSASACAAIPASPRAPSRRSPTRASISARSPRRRSSSPC